MDEAQGVVEVDSGDLAVGPHAQFQDGDDAAELVEAAVGCLVIRVHVSSLATGHRSRQGAGVSEGSAEAWGSCAARYGHPGQVVG